jgi:hypothetical protein
VPAPATIIIPDPVPAHAMPAVLLPYCRTASYDETEEGAHYISKRTSSAAAEAAGRGGGAGGEDAVAATRARIDKLKLSGAVPAEDKHAEGETAVWAEAGGWRMDGDMGWALLLRSRVVWHSCRRHGCPRPTSCMTPVATLQIARSG